MKRIVFVCLALFVAAGVRPAGIAAQPYNVSLSLNPVSWMAGFYGFEVSVPLGSVVEIAGQATMFNEDFVESTYDTNVKTSADRPFFYPFRGGPVLRLFPFEPLSGGFVSGRLSYVRVSGADDDAKPDDEFAAGIDIGYRQLFSAGQGWGWLMHAYAGFERILSGNKNAPPVLPVIGFRAGLYF